MAAATLMAAAALPNSELKKRDIYVLLVTFQVGRRSDLLQLVGPTT